MKEIDKLKAPPERKYLKDLVIACEVALKEMDAIFAPGIIPTNRGSLVAKSMNKLNCIKDEAKHFGLGLPLGKEVKR